MMGQRWGPKNVEKAYGPIKFKAVGYGLHSAKHVVVRVQSGNGFDWGEKFSDDLVRGFVVGKHTDNPRVAKLMGSGENFG